MLLLMNTPSALLLRDARTRAGLSRRALAARAGTPTSTVSRIESGQSDPTVPMLERLLAAAGCRLRIEATPADDPPTIAALASAVEQQGGRLKIDWTRLRGFADWAERHPRELGDALESPPIRTHTPLDAILAAFAEELARRHRIKRPQWTRSVGPLPDPWSPPSTPRMRAAAAASSPEPFRRRNLVVSETALFRSKK